MSEQKVVIVSGSGKGIGKEVALHFAKNDYRVVIAEINSDLGKRTAKEISNQDGTGLFIQTDVSVVSEILQMVKQTIDTFGQIDVLINNAGISEFADIFEMTEAHWDKIIDTNLKSVFFASCEVARYMKGQGGSIINIASTRALMSEPNCEAYAASKGGIVSLTHALAASLSEFKITVNAILPGWIETGDYESLSRKNHDQHFSKRVGKPADIAKACFFLANNENSFINGTQLIIDGGMTRKMIYE